MRAALSGSGPVIDARGAALRVLVVEDEPMIGMIIEDVVEELGWQMVGPVANLADALSLARTEQIDCAVLDVNIRGGRTYPVAELLLGRGIPMIIATGYGERALPESVHGERRLEKPYTSAQLHEELRLLAKRASVRGI